jgi:hypothetical protein
MNALDIPKKNLPDASKAIEDSRVELARDARNKLGYKVLFQMIVDPKALLLTLRELGIRPLDTERVHLYMASTTKSGWYSGTKHGMLSIFCLLVSLSLLGAGIAHKVHYEWPGWRYGVNWFLLGLSACCLAWLIYTTNERWGHGDRKVQKWQRYPIGSYNGSIPEFVLSKALQIKDRLPEADFKIVQLVTSYEHKNAPIRMPDPFLYVSANEYSTEGYYIEVWNEKAYEKEL